MSRKLFGLPAKAAAAPGDSRLVDVDAVRVKKSFWNFAKMHGCLCAGRRSRLGLDLSPLSPSTAAVAVAVGVAGGVERAEVGQVISATLGALNDVVDDRPAARAPARRGARHYGALVLVTPERHSRKGPSTPDCRSRSRGGGAA